MNEKFYIEAKVQKIDEKIEEAIKKSGIVYPHHSLAFFRARYAKVDGASANGNGVILAESVKEDVPYLVGTQCNMNHYRRNWILGSIIDAFVNDNEEIEIVFTFDKVIYKGEYQEALELMEEGKLTVSFELSVEKKNVEIVNGIYKKLNHVEFLGVGVLFGVKPAYKDADVFETAMKEIEQMLNQEDKNLVFANIKDVAQKWAKIGELIEKTIDEKSNINNKEGVEVDKKANDALLAKLKADVIAEFGEEAVKDWTDEDFTDEKIQALRESLQTPKEEVAEAETTEVSEEVKEEVVEAEVVKRETETEQKVEVTYDTETQVETVKVETEQVTKVDDVVKEVVKTVEERVYNYAEVEAIKAEYEIKLQEKDSIIAEKEEQIKFQKEFAQKVVEIREEMGDYVKDLSDEDLFNETKMKIAKLEKENAELKASKVEVASEKEEKEVVEDLATGHEEIVVEDKETSDDRIATYLKTKYNK